MQFDLDGSFEELSMATDFRNTHDRSKVWVLFVSTYNKLQSGTFLVALDLKEHVRACKTRNLKIKKILERLQTLKPLLGLT